MSSQFALEQLKKIPNVGPKAASALLKKGYRSLEDVASAVPQDIKDILACSMNKAKKVIAAANTLQVDDIKPPLTAEEYQEEMDAKIYTLEVRSKKFNEMVGGGFKTSATVGLSGPQASGKTQICNELIVDAQMKGKHAIFFETELDTFSNRRLRQIAGLRGHVYDPKMVLLTPATRIRDVGTQYYQYQRARDIARSQKLDVGVIVVDSLTALFQRKYTGRDMLPGRKQELGRHLSFLEDMAKEFNAVLVCTCQVIECPVSPLEAKGGFSSATVYARYGTNYMPWGGNILKHTLGTWISLVKIKKNLWQGVLFDSSELPNKTIEFVLDAKGVSDVVRKELV